MGRQVKWKNLFCLDKFKLISCLSLPLEEILYRVIFIGGGNKLPPNRQL